MAFSSVQFLFVFLPLALAVYWICPKRLRNIVLGAFSLLFFAWAGLKGAAVLVLLACINWLGGLWLGWLAHKKPLLAVLVLLDLAVLGGFKYAGFAAESINAVVPGLLPVLSPALPLGISFYVFTAIGYCVDVAAGRAEPEKSPFKFAVFLAFFGHGPSGPIVRYNQQAPQLDPRSEARKVDLDRFSYGIKRLILGLAKKAIIADQLALIYAKVASVPAATLPAPILILGYTAYMMQLYFDFSGYSDMAIGIGEFFGITLPENFDVPYQALTIRGFWKGWHITMTRFFTRYLYIPLGGSRKGTSRTCVNTIIIFLASGLWHGADWSFVVWGGLHGIAMVADRLLGSRLEKVHPALSWTVTFAYVNLCWIFFRADSIHQALSMGKAIARCNFGALSDQFTDNFQLALPAWIGREMGITLPRLALLMFLAFTAFALVFCLQEKPVKNRKFVMTGKKGVLAGVLLFWSIISLGTVTQFIYSNF